MCAYKLKENSGKCFDYSYPMFRVAQECFWDSERHGRKLTTFLNFIPPDM